MTKTISSIHDVVASIAFKSGGRFTPTLVRGPRDDEDTDLQRALFTFWGGYGVSVTYDPNGGAVEYCRVYCVTEEGDGGLWDEPDRVYSVETILSVLRYVSNLAAGNGNGGLVIAL